jgi:hypothetical protein
MSRFDCDGDGPEYNNAWELHDQAGLNALRGKRGQLVLKELEVALLALPEKKLLNGKLSKNGGVCAIGALALKRRIEAGEARDAALKWMEEQVDPEDSEQWGEQTTYFAKKHLGIVGALANKISYENDEGADYIPGHKETDEERFERVLKWVRENIKR